MVDDEAWFSAGCFFDLFFLDVVDFDFFRVTTFGVVSGQSAGFFEGAVRQLLSFALDNNVGARDAFGMEPPVVACGEFEGRSGSYSCPHTYGSHLMRYSGMACC